MTWNLWNERVSATPWETRVEAVRRVVRDVAPTIFAAQECTQPMYDDLTLSELPYRTPFVPSDANTGEALVCMATRPIRASWFERLPDGRRDKNHRRVLWCSVDDALVGNVHLSYDADDADRQLRALLESPDARRADVLMGDFNVYAEDLPAFDRLVHAHGWVSAYQGRTWSAATTLRNPADRVLVRSQPRRSFSVGGSEGYASASDHRAVVVDVV